MELRSKLMDKAHEASKAVYLFTLNLPQKYQFSLGEQLRRSILSVPLNITEGNARLTDKEKRQFLNIAFGSLKEAKYTLFFCKDIGLIECNEYNTLYMRLDELSRILYSIIHPKS